MLVKLKECMQGWRRVFAWCFCRNLWYLWQMIVDACLEKAFYSGLSSSFHENRCYYIHQCVSAVGLTKRVYLGLFGLNTTTCLCYSEAEGLKWRWLGGGTFCVLWLCTVGLSCTTVWVCVKVNHPPVILQYNRFIGSFMWCFKQLLKK